MIVFNDPPRKAEPITKLCSECGREYQAKRDRSRWCSPACKQRAYRRRLLARLIIITVVPDYSNQTVTE